METNIEQTESFDHPPTPAELVEIYQQSEKNDPRSLFYERKLERPKPPVGQLLLCIGAVAAACTAAALGLQALRLNFVLRLCGTVAAGLLAVLLLAKALLVNAVKLYQAWAPAKLRNRCRYEPSCSAYMLLAVEKYGIFRGFPKGLKRWKGCKAPNGGYDFP